MALDLGHNNPFDLNRRLTPAPRNVEATYGSFA